MNKYLLGLSLGMLAFSACDDEEVLVSEPTAFCDPLSARTFSGPESTFLVGDNLADNLSGFSATGGTEDGGVIGGGSTVVVVDASDTIRFVFPDVEALEGNDFDGAASGTYQVYSLVTQYTLGNAGVGDAFSGITGCFAASDPVTLRLDACATSPGSISVVGAPPEEEPTPDTLRFDVGDDGADIIEASSLELTFGEGNTRYLFIDADGTILALEDDLDDVDVSADLSGDLVRLHLVSTVDEVNGDEVGSNLADVTGCFTPSSEFVVIVRECGVSGGVLSGGPFGFIVDGEADFVSGLSLAGASGANSTYVITDADLNILGLPPTLADVEAVNFDDANGGTCLIWHLSFGNDLGGAAAGANAADLTGCFDLSNPITVERLCNAEGGTLEGGPFSFTVGDGTPDNVSGLSLSGRAANLPGTYVITDGDGEILGLPSTMDDLMDVDFDGTGAGTCLIWYLSVGDGFAGGEIGANAGTDLSGCYDLSNPITVNRTN